MEKQTTSKKEVLVVDRLDCLAEDPEKKKRLAEGKWGAWYLIKGRRKWFGINRAYPYEFEFSRLKSETCLEWIAHLREKTWMKRGDIEDLMLAFDDLFGYGWMYDEINTLRGYIPKKQKGKSNEY